MYQDKKRRRHGLPNICTHGAAGTKALAIDGTQSVLVTPKNPSGRSAASTVATAVVHVPRAEQHPTERARAELELPADRLCALVALGAGVIDDAVAPAIVAVDALTAHRDILACITSPKVAALRSEEPATSLLQVRPLGRYLPAFDLAISAAGYNSVHELLDARVPTLLIPNAETAADDQVARAQWAAAREVALTARADDPEEVRAGVTRLLDADERRRLTCACQHLPAALGAVAIARRLVAS